MGDGGQRSADPAGQRFDGCPVIPVSGQQRLTEVIGSPAPDAGGTKPALRPFAGAMRQDDEGGLPFNLQDYLDLLDTSGRAVHPHKRGAIPDSTPRLLASLGLAPGEWLKSVAELHARFRFFIGAPHRLARLAENRGWRWIRGQTAARRLYGRTNE